MLGMNVETGLEHVPGPTLFAAIVLGAFVTGLALHAWIRSAPTEPAERPEPAPPLRPTRARA